MADVDASKPPSLAEDYLLVEKNQNMVVAEDTVQKEKPSAVEATNVASEESKDSNSVGDSADSAPSEESSDNAESGDTAEQEAEETPEIKLETAPADFRFPTTNQTRHCFTRYIEYHRCIAAKGEEAPECDKFAKYYRSLCPGEWVDRWNEQRENGTFPGPL
ncbi:cytochrome c oxidase subunit 6b-1-like [Salvia splendens]|uniref:cytochrome c oxidase subunit 6b-1-like n=1 Tax=Salvia splendens TaxID=180675 RepID=UPI001C26E176|nr:cytochrome c oxidase subunit 6b-1-like [Salvia splendens]